MPLKGNVNTETTLGGWRFATSHAPKSVVPSNIQWEGENVTPILSRKEYAALESTCDNAARLYLNNDLYGFSSINTPRSFTLPENIFVMGDMHSANGRLEADVNSLVTGSMLSSATTAIKAGALVMGGVSAGGGVLVGSSAFVGNPNRVDYDKLPLPLWCSVAILAKGDITIAEDAHIFGSIISLDGSVKVSEGAKVYGQVCDKGTGLPPHGLTYLDAHSLLGRVVPYSPLGSRFTAGESADTPSMFGERYYLRGGQRREWRKSNEAWMEAWNKKFDYVPVNDGYQKRQCMPNGGSYLSHDPADKSHYYVQPYYGNNVSYLLHRNKTVQLWRDSFVVGDIEVPARKRLVIPDNSFVDGRIALRGGATLELGNGAQVAGGIITTVKNRIKVGKNCVVHNGITGDRRELTVDAPHGVSEPTLDNPNVRVAGMNYDSVWAWGSHHCQRMNAVTGVSDALVTLNFYISHRSSLAMMYAY